MLALAIEFSRCSRARTLKAEQCVLMTPPTERHPFATAPIHKGTQRRNARLLAMPAGWDCQKNSQCIDLELPDITLSEASSGRIVRVPMTP